MNHLRMPTIVARFFNDVADEVARARAKFPDNKHMMGAFHEEVGEVAKAMLERDYQSAGEHLYPDLESPHNLSLDEEVYKECVQAAAMALRVATEGDPDYLYHNPYYREMDSNEDSLPAPGPGEAVEINIRDVQVQLDSIPKNVMLTHLPTGCFVHCTQYDTEQENEAAALKELNELVKAHLAWGTKNADEPLEIPAFLRRGED